MIEGSVFLKAIILLSGGIDSMACMHFYQNHGYNTVPVFYDYRQPAAKMEYKSANNIARFYTRTLNIIRVSFMNIPKEGEICGRNAVLILLTLMKFGAGAYKIIIGLHDGCSYKDCSIQFISQINKLLDLYTDGMVILEAPFSNMTKKDIIKYCRKYNLPLELTYSCERGCYPPCGQCLSCKDRMELLNEKYV